MTDIVGQRLGDYQIESVLGRGNVGIVYRAVDLRLDSRVALKVLQQGLANDPNFRARFFREAQAATSLAHRNIVQIKHLGEHDGTPYIVMELITGGTLGSLFSHYSETDPQQSLLRMVELIRQAADGLGAAHARGVVHRDIKPDNLLLSKSDQGDDYILKVADFGIARAESMDATLSGAIVGSPAYMSPEQWRGDKADGRSDLYSLGVVLYEVCTGCVPFEASSAAASMYKHLSEEPVPPRQLKKAIPPELDAVILRCLKKNKEERFQTAAELSQALQRVIDKMRPSAMVAIPHHPLVPSNEQGIVIRDDVNLIPPPIPQTPRERRPFPVVLVLDQQGNILSQMPLMKSLRVGRSADNDLVLPTPDVAPYHTRFDWDGERVSVTDLQSLNGTFMGGQKVLTNVSQRLTEDTWVRLGRTWIWIWPKEDVPPPPPPVSIFIELDREFREMTLTPGQPVVCKITLVNRGARVDEVSIGIEGFPLDWIQGEERVHELMPNREVRASLTINVPKQASSVAKVYEVTLRTKSRAHPGDTGIEEAKWKVLPFYAAAIDIDPIKVSGRTDARYSVNLINAGNKLTEYTLTAKDDERSVDFFFTDDKNSEQSRVKVEVPPGEKAVLKLKARATKYWIGTPKPYSFSIQAATADSQQVENTEAQFIHSPIFPIWLAIAAPLVLLLALWFVPDMLRPKILSFDTDKKEYRAKEMVNVSWLISKANNPELINDGKSINPQKKDGYEFEAPETTEEKTVLLKLRAQGIFGGEDTKEITIKIKPLPPPDAVRPTGSFNVTPSLVKLGDAVTITWNISNAESVDISTIGSGLPLQGSATDNPLQSKSYILTAENKGKQFTSQKDIVVSTPTPTPAPTATPTPTPTPTPKPATIVSFIITSQEKKRPNPMNLRPGDKVTLSWEVRDAASVRIEGVPGFDPLPLRGKLTTVCVPNEGDTTFQLFAKGADKQEISRTQQARTKCGGWIGLPGIGCNCGTYRTELIK